MGWKTKDLGWLYSVRAERLTGIAARYYLKNLSSPPSAEFIECGAIFQIDPVQQAVIIPKPLGVLHRKMEFGDLAIKRWSHIDALLRTFNLIRPCDGIDIAILNRSSRNDHSSDLGGGVAKIFEYRLEYENILPARISSEAYVNTFKVDVGAQLSLSTSLSKLDSIPCSVGGIFGGFGLYKANAEKPSRHNHQQKIEERNRIWKKSLPERLIFYVLVGLGAFIGCLLIALSKGLI